PRGALARAAGARVEPDPRRGARQAAGALHAGGARGRDRPGREAERGAGGHLGMKRHLIIAVFAVGGAGAVGGSARADEALPVERTERERKAEKRVRATATVEVIDDAHHVDDIISRLKS